MNVYYTHKRNSVSKLRKSLTKCNPNTSHYKCYDVDVFVSEGSCVEDLVAGVVTLKNSRAVNLWAPLGCPWVTRVLPLGIKVSPVGSAADSFLSSSVSPFFACVPPDMRSFLPMAELMPMSCQWACITVHKTSHFSSWISQDCVFCYSNRKWTCVCP